MKNKIYALALSLGMFSQLSCAMEPKSDKENIDFNVPSNGENVGHELIKIDKKIIDSAPSFHIKKINHENIQFDDKTLSLLLNNIIKGKDSSDIKLLNSLTIFESPEKSRFSDANNDSNINCDFLYNKLLNNLKKEKQRKYIKNLPDDIRYIHEIDASVDFDIHKYLKRFDKCDPKVIIKIYVDYLGKKYYNMTSSAVSSRHGNIKFMSQYSGTTWEEEMLTWIFCKFYEIYRNIFNLPQQLTDNAEQLKFKTKFIHFIEECIVMPNMDKIFSCFTFDDVHYWDGYNRLCHILLCLNNFYYENFSEEEFDKILDVWKTYCKNGFKVPKDTIELTEGYIERLLDLMKLALDNRGKNITNNKKKFIK